jgi:hypothetical protein
VLVAFFLHPSFCISLLCRLQGRFDTWRAQLDAGFNLLFYGFGSKKVGCLFADTRSRPRRCKLSPALFFEPIFAPRALLTLPKRRL